MRFLSPGTLDIVVWTLLGQAVLGTMGGIAASQASVYQMPMGPSGDDNQKCLQVLPDVSWGVKSLPV